LSTTKQSKFVQVVRTPGIMYFCRCLKRPLLCDFDYLEKYTNVSFLQTKQFGQLNKEATIYVRNNRRCLCLLFHHGVSIVVDLFVTLRGLPRRRRFPTQMSEDTLTVTLFVESPCLQNTWSPRVSARLRHQDNRIYYNTKCSFTFPRLNFSHE
jgi:hypothetical protein